MVAPTDELGANRAMALESALASSRMAGLEPSGDAMAIFQRYVDGELTLEAMGAAVESLRSEFEALGEAWARETRHSSSVKSMVSHPSYLRIIGMGKEVLPLVLSELRDRPNHWLVALNAITGEDPAPPASTFEEAVKAWLKWGMAKGLLE